jgi:hypothetical protein
VAFPLPELLLEDELVEVAPSPLVDELEEELEETLLLSFPLTSWVLRLPKCPVSVSAMPLCGLVRAFD